MPRRDPQADDAFLRLFGARQNNLKNLDVAFPHAALSVVTGVSGSGKSSLAFDTIYAEGQRRYVECVSTYAKQFLDRLPRPDYDRMDGLAPALAIRQGAAAQTGRSTVGTVTEIADYLRLLVARVGETRCSSCRNVVPRHSIDSVLEATLRHEGEEVSVVVTLHAAPGERPPAVWERALSRGFLRGKPRGADDWLRLDEPLPASAKGPIRVLVDRLRAVPENRMRLREALELGWREGEGKLDIERPGGESLSYADGRVCPTCGRTFPEPRPQLFSFNSPYGACPDCKGFGNILTFTLERVVPDPGKTILEGALDPWANSWRGWFLPKMKKLAQEEGFSLDVPFRSLAEKHRKILLYGAPGFRGVFPFLERLRAKSYKSSARFLVKRYQETVTCAACGGIRLKPEALEVYVGGSNIAELLTMTVGALRDFMGGLTLDPVREAVAAPILTELRGRLEYLGHVGLDYLTLDRASKTLSGGEAQRIELANALGGSLSHALYVLDEPTVGLHPRDTDRLIRVLHRLRERDNTVLVVEHDPDVIASADWIVELGPGAGQRGGELLYQGPIAAWPAREEALEPPELAAETPPEYRAAPKRGKRGGGAGGAGAGGAGGSAIEVRGAREHNLKGIDVRFPVGALSGVCGVSGSGKSTLVEEILWRSAARSLGETAPSPGAHDRVTGLDAFTRVALVDQSPVARSSRSNPATYVKAFDKIRERYARAPLARERKYTPGTFSFNVAGGRCETCEGAGVTKVEMYFLADLWVPCDACGGRRYRPEVLDVTVHGFSIDALLDKTVEEAISLFHDETDIVEPLWVLERVGLGYLRLGQPLTTLSGGETQRLKLARELSDRAAPETLYLLDEPTVGLHRKDVRTLLRVLRELTRRGGTVIAVEHNLDFLAACDHLIELGPEGGAGGGRLIAEGSPAALARSDVSATGAYLRKIAACA
ncbi:MAG: excinuclease ABC subunit UvrA [Hyphomicrobiales bacterium]